MREAAKISEGEMATRLEELTESLNDAKDVEVVLRSEVAASDKQREEATARAEVREAWQTGVGCTYLEYVLSQLGCVLLR